MNINYEPEIKLPAGISSHSELKLIAYQKAALGSDKLPFEDFETPLLGLFGEIGSLLSELKKKRRDPISTEKYNEAILEELGDVLWYFCAITSRANLDFSVLGEQLTGYNNSKQSSDTTFNNLQQLNLGPVTNEEFGRRLVELAGKVGNLHEEFRNNPTIRNESVLSNHLVSILRALVAASDAAKINMQEAAILNLKKIFNRWPLAEIYPKLIDEKMPPDEKLPRKFTIFFEEQTIKKKTYVIQKCRGIIIGDRLTDNKIFNDDYRFHDVFHIAFAVYLGWSPVLRALLHLKRKSDPLIDETQDGARAILIEEGVATFIFGRGLIPEAAQTQKVEYDLLKSIKRFVEGYEVQRCCLWQWEKAIINGFRVFEKLKQHRKGYVIADLLAHTLEFSIVDKT